MTAEKIRIRKYQQLKIDKWCDALEIPNARFVEDAINFYLRHLDGKAPMLSLTSSSPIQNSEVKTIIDESNSLDNLEDFHGCIEL